MPAQSTLQKAWLVLVACCVIFSVQADNQKAREQYLAAKKQLQLGNYEGFQAASQSLQDYSLFPYLRYSDLYYQISQQPNQVSFEQLQQFRRQYPAFIKHNALRKYWLKKNLAHKNFALVDAHLSRYPQLGMSCEAAVAAYHVHGPSALKAATDHYLVGHSRKGTCDAVIQLMHANGLITDTMRRARIEKAIAKGNFKFARYLAKQLPKSSKTAWYNALTVIEHPTRVLHKKTHTLLTKQFNEAQQSTLYQAIIKQATQTQPQWVHDNRHKLYALHPIIREHIYEHLPRALLTKDESVGYQFLQSVVKAHPTHRNLKQLGLEAMLRADTTLAVSAFEALQAVSQDTDADAYWMARAYHANGDWVKARRLWQSLAKKRGYYGFMSSAKLATAPSLNQSQQVQSGYATQQLKQQLAVQQVIELKKAQEHWLSRELWQSIVIQADDKQKQALSLLAHQEAWYDLSIIAMVGASQNDNLTMRFPLAYKEIYAMNSRANAIPRPLLYAVSRQESSFNHKAQSRSGAIGLMQLLPTTARYIAKKHSIPRSTSKTDLMRVDTNVALGAAYLSHLFELTQGQWVPSIASYNAGPNRVKRWMKRSQVPTDLWIELIPYKETRQYVKNVLTYQTIYAKRLKEPELISEVIHQAVNAY